MLEIQEVKVSLGDEEADLELRECFEESNQARPRVTLRSLLDRVRSRLDHYVSKKSQTMSLYSDLIAKISSIKSQLGLSTADHGSTIDLSTKHLDQMRSEQEALLSERARRLKRLDVLISDLDDLSTKIGEDSISILAEIHHSLKTYHQANSNSDVTVDLCDDVMVKLSEKIQSMHQVSAEREYELGDLSNVIRNLFSALDLQSEQRTEIEAALAGPARLWPSTIKACHDELHRLETQAGKEIKDQIVMKAKEIEATCAASRLLAPDLSQLLIDMSNGNAGLVLSKIMRIMADTENLAQVRAPCVTLVNEVEEVRAEIEWLAQYEADANRYKGRDVNKNIARATKAQSLRLKAPSLLETTREAIHDWSLKQGASFLFLGQDYADVVKEMTLAVEMALSEKQVGSKNAKSSAAAPPPPGNRSSQKSSLPNMSLSLNKRHSIAIIDSGSSGGKAVSSRSTTKQQATPAARPKAVSGGGELIPMNQIASTPPPGSIGKANQKTPISVSSSGSQSARQGSTYAGSNLTPVSKLRDLGESNLSDVVEEVDQSVKHSVAPSRSRIPRPV